MSTTPPPAPLARRRWLQFSLWTLMVLVLMLGSTSVVVLILIWPSVRVLLVPMATPVPVEMVELTKDESGPGDLAVASGSDAETGTDDIDEPAESQASSNPDFGLRSMEDQMAVLDDIATIAAIMAMDQGDSYDLGQGQAHAGFTRSSVAATGDDIVPPWQRWEVRFVTSGLQLYARQLDSLKVELGAVGGGRGEVDYAFNLTKERPDRRTGNPEAEQRLYMTWRDEDNPIAQFDQKLLQRAGINAERRIILRFFPPDVVRQLLVLESQEAKGRDPRTVLKTIFGVRPSGQGFEFYLIDQLYRPVPKS